MSVNKFSWIKIIVVIVKLRSHSKGWVRFKVRVKINPQNSQSEIFSSPTRTRRRSDWMTPEPPQEHFSPPSFSQPPATAQLQGCTPVYHSYRGNHHLRLKNIKSIKKSMINHTKYQHPVATESYSRNAANPCRKSPRHCLPDSVFVEDFCRVEITRSVISSSHH